MFIGLDGVRTRVLQLVRLQFVQEPDAAPFLVEIDNHAAPFVRDEFHCGVQLPAAVAPCRMKDVAGEALRMHPREHVVMTMHIAEDQRNVFVVIDIVAVADDAELAELRWEPCFGHAVHQALRAQPMRDELRDRDERQSVRSGEGLQLRTFGCGAVIVEDFANHTGRLQPGKAHQVDSRFRVPDALEHATLARAQRVQVPRTAKIRGHRVGVAHHPNRGGLIRRTDARGHAKSGRRIHGHGVCRAHGIAVLRAHHRQIELPDARRREREADHAFRAHHEVHLVGRDELRSGDEVAFVFAVFIISDDNELARLQIFDRLLNRSKRHRCTGRRA